MITWIDRWPDLLDEEMRLLREAGMLVERDEQARTQGIVRLIVRPQRDGLPEELIVTFPDAFPYFRFEIQAHGVVLPRHQNPLSKNLCVLPRNSSYWTNQDAANNSLCHFILHRVPLVLAAGNPATPEDERPDEFPQGEPLSDYYGYDRPGAYVVNSDWQIEARYLSGSVDVGIRHSPFCGAVLRVRNEDGKLLASSSPAIDRIYSKNQLKGRWVRGTPANSNNRREFYQGVAAIDPMKESPPKNIGKPNLQIYALLFSEESQQGVVRDGWMFALRVEDNSHVDRASRPKTPKIKQRRGKRRK